MKNEVSRSRMTTLSTHFTPETSKQFQWEMDQALRTIELREVIKVLHKYNLEKDSNVKEFLEAFTEMLKIWQKPNKGTQIVGKASTRGSKCVACEIGKNMTVYEFQYQHLGADEPYNRIIYGYDFGILYDIRDGILHDLRICNAFLSRSEAEELNK